MTMTIELGGITIEVQRKAIKNIHLRVRPPDGHVSISAPYRTGIDTITAFARSRLTWIAKQQARIRAMEHQVPLQFIDGESHPLWGKPYSLKVVEADRAPYIMEGHTQLLMSVRPGANTVKRQSVMDAWYGEQVKLAAAPLILKWEPILNVKAKRLSVRLMKTRWGSCVPSKGGIRLNIQLAKKPPECLEYVVVHELVHLLEPSHNARFKSLLDQFMPDWREVRGKLALLPLRDEQPRD
jgi:predicted metal-dependent hydrolase